MSRREDLKVRNIGLVIAGIGIGCAITLLLAPNTGEDLRYAIGRGCRKTAKVVKRRAESLRDDVEDIVEQVSHLGKQAQDFGQRGLHFVKDFRIA